MLARAETDADFFGRRAMEEARAAATARSNAARAAHRHMAAIYAARLREEQLAAEGVGTLGDLAHRELSPAAEDGGDFEAADRNEAARHR